MHVTWHSRPHASTTALVFAFVWYGQLLHAKVDVDAKANGCQAGETRQAPKHALAAHGQSQRGDCHSGLGCEHSIEEVFAALPMPLGSRAIHADLQLVQ